MLEVLHEKDSEIYELTMEELGRQRSKIELIASENFTSVAVMQALGSINTNKYAEGYPGKRYYGGCEVVDKIENIARDRVKALFGAEHANVQPHSGSQANQCAYFALLELGDVVMGMDLSHGGHLTHGSPVNMSGKYFKFVSYGVEKETQMLDYDNVRKIALECKPKMIVAGASAYARAIDFKRLREIADEVGAYLMVDMAHIAGLVAAGLHMNPVPYSHVVTSTTHKTLRGPRGGIILCTAELGPKIDKALFPGIQGGPLMHGVAAKAVCFKEAAKPEFKEYQKKVIENAACLASELMKRGFNIVSGGTDNHLMLVDLRNKGITGKFAENLLDEIGVTVNKNTVPFETESPFVTSGVRIGTPAVTTRGFGKEEMAVIAEIIAGIIANPEDKATYSKKVEELCSRFPLYPTL